MKAYQRLIEYVSFPTASQEGASNTPSSDSQLKLANYIVDELKALGVSDASVDKKCYVTATIEPTDKKWKGKTVGFIAHLDVSNEVPSENIKTKIIKNYNGNDIHLNSNDVLSSKLFPVLNNYIGKTLIVTDGQTLLGADDKAGIAEIMTMAEYYLTHPEVPHGKIKICFTPDEEIGSGADDLDINKFGADFAYTVDGAAAGDVEYQNFNAASVHISIQGKAIHPGEAKGKMINAASVAALFDSMLPKCERPENTSGFEGFYHLCEMKGNVENAELLYIIRDHNIDILNMRKHKCIEIANHLNTIYDKGTVNIKITDSYFNMENIINKYPEIIKAAKEATKEVGLEPVSNPIRGGTDGARLSYRGLPCPNLGTGSHNHHSRFEFACIEAMDDVTNILINIVQKFI